MNKDKQVLIEINGLEIKTNSVYKVTNKPDPNAPTGFVREGTTKLPSEGIGNTVPARFEVTNKAKGTGVFDTGLYFESPCYATQDRDSVSNKVAILNKAIVTPYEQKNGRGTLDHANEDFWKDFGVDLFEGRYFVTSNVDDLLELYIAMTGYELTPKGLEGDPKFNESQFCIEDKEVVRNIKDTRANNIVECLTNYGTLLNTNPTTLKNIFRYIRLIGISDDIDNITLNSLFYEWLNKSDDNPLNFKAVYELSQNKDTADIVNLYVIVNKLVNKGIVTRGFGGNYVYKGEELGADLKIVAKNLNSKKEFQEIKIELLETEID